MSYLTYMLHDRDFREKNNMSYLGLFSRLICNKLKA